MTEEYENAVSILADQLESSGIVKHASTSRFEFGAIKGILETLGNRSREAKQFFQRLFFPQQPHTVLGTNLQTGADIQLQPLNDPPLWLLFCINGSDLAILEHLDVRPVCSDNQLFVNLRKAYVRLRSEVTWVRRCLTKLGHIHFVQVHHPLNHPFSNMLLISESSNSSPKPTSTASKSINFHPLQKTHTNTHE